MAGVWYHYHGDASTDIADEQQRQYMVEDLRPAVQGRFTSDALEVDDDDPEDLERLMSEVYALEMHREELRLAEQLHLDEAVAISLADAEACKLLGQSNADDDNDDEDLVVISPSDLESKPAPSCTCCLTQLDNERTRRILPCGHLYCLLCVTTRAGMSVRDRTLLPAHCCRKEFPIDYVKEALKPSDFALYERFLKEKHWTSLDLESDKEYAHAAKQNGCKQCPGCGIGVSKISGCNRMKCCNGHEFCFDCGKVWKTCSCYYPGGGY